ncbi:MAG: histidine phosphatase family protein [Actinomycetia bacterium]|jgi:phosphohistidine phosphatase|nr:histidine phosphatase family protein [Actinomycetes bacterium]
MNRKLVVLRHAKSDWPIGVPDQDRPLGRRGKRDAAAAGRWVAEHVGTPDLAVVSTARRTVQTWEVAAAELSGDPTVSLDDRVYDATVRDLLEVLTGVPKATECVLLVGHNPGVQELVLALTGPGDDEGRLLAETKYPTSGLAVLTVDCKWPDLGPGKARLVDFVVPRG